MPAESPIFDRKESAKIRRRVGEIARDALDKLAEELEDHAGPRGCGVSETWAKKFKIIADQIRRDFRLEDDPAEPAAVKGFSADPLGALRVVSEDEEVA